MAGGLNLYGFANGDPVNFTDPFGLCEESKDGEVTDCERFARFVEELAKNATSDLEFIQQLGTLVAGLEGGTIEGSVIVPEIQFGSSGFREDLVDDANPARHYSAYVVAGFEVGALGAAGIAVGRELCDGPACSTQDIRLGVIGARHGQSLGVYQPAGRFRLADWIRKEL